MDYIGFLKEWEAIDHNDLLPFEVTEEEIEHPYGKADMVNSPSHYTNGKVEVIEIIEDAVETAPGPVEGVLQGNALKYLLRLWLKENSLQDAKKARWYLDRLIKKLEAE